MSRSRWTPLLTALAAGAAAWLVWRFLPRDWIGRCCGTAGDARRTAGAGTDESRFSRPGAARSPAARPGSAEARIVDPAAEETAEEAAADAPVEPGATQADDPARCAAVTQGGTRCSREAEPGATHCWQHGG
jgi:hypothetical protein